MKWTECPDCGTNEFRYGDEDNRIRCKKCHKIHIAFDDDLNSDSF